MFIDHYEGEAPEVVDMAIDKHFSTWFKNFVENDNNQIIDPILRALSWGPSRKATSWPAYFINGCNFHTIHHCDGKAASNYGVCVQHAGTNTEFYGSLLDVVSMEYHGACGNLSIVLFDCMWYDPLHGVKKYSAYNLVDINIHKLYKRYDPFILAQHAIQVYYMHYPSLRQNRNDWMVACIIKSRRMVQVYWADKDDMAYQNDEMLVTPTTTNILEVPLHRDPEGINLVVDLSEIVACTHYPNDDDDDDEGSEYEYVSDDDDSDDDDY